MPHDQEHIIIRKKARKTNQALSPKTQARNRKQQEIYHELKKDIEAALGKDTPTPDFESHTDSIHTNVKIFKRNLTLNEFLSNTTEIMEYYQLGKKIDLELRNRDPDLKYRPKVTTSLKDELDLTTHQWEIATRVYEIFKALPKMIRYLKIVQITHFRLIDEKKSQELAGIVRIGALMTPDD